MKKNRLFVLPYLFVFFILISATMVFCQISFTVSPLIQELTVSPGVTRDFRLTVFAGHSKQPEMHFLVYPADFRLNRDGKIDFFEPGSIKRSAGSWIKIDPAEFTMKPGETKDVKVKLTVPRNVSGGYYTAILVQLLPEIPPEMKIGTVRTWRMASILELTVTGWKKPRVQVSISNLKVESSSEEKGLTFVVTVENKGDVHTRGEGNLAITTREGRRIAELPLEAGRGTVFPESMRDFKAVLERELPRGEYFADATFKYGNRRARAKVSFSVGEASVEGEEFTRKKEINFSVSPAVVEINAPPGSVRSTKFMITNEESQPVHYRVYFKDISINPDGKITLLKAASTPRSCSNWLEFKGSEFELAPLQRKNISGLLKVPKDVAGGKYTRLVIEASTTGGKEGRKMTTIVPQTIIMVTVGNKLERKGEITKFQFLSTNDSSSQFLTIFKNTGNIHLRVQGNITLKDKIGNTVAELPFAEGEVFVFPGCTRNFTVSLAESFQAGEYKAEVRFFSQKKELVTATKQVTIRE